MERVKFYSKNDMSIGSNLKKIEVLCKEYSGGKEIRDINDVIELFNIKKILDNEIYFKSWTPEIIEQYKKIINSFSGCMAIYIKSINSGNLKTMYADVEPLYIEDFWELVEKYKAFENVSMVAFRDFLETMDIKLYQLLKFKNIVGYFGAIIREFMLNDCSSAELLLDKYEIKHINDIESLCLPKELKCADKEAIINNYIDGENPNLNYLRLIANIQSNKDRIEISPKTLLKARKKAEEKESQLFNSGSSISMETAIEFSKSQESEVDAKIEDQSVNIIYGAKWIESNKDYPTLLNNFIYLFEYVDLQMRCNLVNKYNRMGVLERFLKMYSKNAYIKGIAFEQLDTISLLQMYGYYNQLFSIGTRLEEVIEWLFKEYLSNEFNANNFRVQMPSRYSTYLEKCNIIVTALESVLKQYSLFVQEGEIDYELLDVRSEQLNYKNIPSLVQKKYVYGIGDEYKIVSKLLFSDQSGLSYDERDNKSYGNFCGLLTNVNIKINDCSDYMKPSISWLIDRKYLTLIEDGHLIFRNKRLIKILKDLYFNEVISYWRYPKSGRIIIDELEKSNLVEFDDSLFSRPEQDYFNYYLNKSQFNNGLDLRNKYVHTQPFYNADEKQHERNYMILLRLFIISIIKINDDFCISSAIKISD